MGLGILRYSKHPVTIFYKDVILGSEDWNLYIFRMLLSNEIKVLQFFVTLSMLQEIKYKLFEKKQSLSVNIL